MIRTSQSHPLYINEIRIGGLAGTIGLTLCPGKVDPAAMTGNWQRDLDTDVAAIAKWGAACVVTLIEPHEFELLKVDQLAEMVDWYEMQWLHLPICDTKAPDRRFEQEWPTTCRHLREVLLNGDGRVLIHCRGGLGRAGTVAALLLIESGMEAFEAIKVVRAARPGAIETIEQEQYIVAYQRAEER